MKPTTKNCLIYSRYSSFMSVGVSSANFIYISLAYNSGNILTSKNNIMLEYVYCQLMMPTIVGESGIACKKNINKIC